MTWIGLAETKAQLNKQLGKTADDAELTGFMAAACAIVEDLKGHVSPVEFTETHSAKRCRERREYGGYLDRWFVDLNETPVLTVSGLVRAAAPGVPVTPVPDPVDSTVEVPTRGDYVVTYVAGRDAVPDNFRLAALELVTHLWRASQLNAASGRPAVGGDQMMVVPGMASALPYRVRELLGLYGAVVSDHVVIA